MRRLGDDTLMIAATMLVCWSAYIDMGIRSDRDLTPEEIIQFTRNDMIYAKKAGYMSTSGRIRAR